MSNKTLCQIVKPLQFQGSITILKIQNSDPKSVQFKGKKTANRAVITAKIEK